MKFACPNFLLFATKANHLVYRSQSICRKFLFIHIYHSQDHLLYNLSVAFQHQTEGICVSQSEGRRSEGYSWAASEGLGRSTERIGESKWWFNLILHNVANVTAASSLGFTVHCTSYYCEIKRIHPSKVYTQNEHRKTRVYLLSNMCRKDEVTIGLQLTFGLVHVLPKF